MSLFDELYASAAAPQLVDHFGDQRSVSVQLGSVWLVTAATGLIRAQETIDEYGDDRIAKRVEMEVDLLVDPTKLPDGGLEAVTTAAKVDVTEPDGTIERWNIEGIRNRSRTFITLKLFRRLGREFSTSGFRRQDS